MLFQWHAFSSSTYENYNKYFSHFNFITSLSSRIFSCLNDKITKLQKHIYFQYLIAKTHRSCHRHTLTTQKWRGSRAGVFVSGMSTCYQAHQALHTPPTTYFSVIQYRQIIRRARRSKWYATVHLPPWSPTTTYYLIQFTAMQYDDKKSSFY